MNRRKLLLMGSTGVVAGVSGCVNQIQGSDPAENGNNEEAPEWCPDGDADYQCGEGEPIEVHENFDDDEEVIYHDNGTVDVVTGSSGGELRWENREFETWAGYTCPEKGAREAIDRTYERLELDMEEAIERGVQSGIGTGPWADDEIAASFRVYTGDKIDDPVSLETVVAAAPMYAETTLTLADREHECTVPVYVQTRDELPKPD